MREERLRIKMVLRQTTSLEEIEREIGAEAPGKAIIWYSVNTCWWTHRQTDLREHPSSSLPCDPRGGMLMMTEPGGAQAFLDQAKANPGHYGRHGLDAFLAAHNDNCLVSDEEPWPTCLRTWEEYNALLDKEAS